MCFTYETGNEVKVKIKNFFARFSKGKYRKTKLVREKITFCGVGVLPYMDHYKLTVPGGKKVAMFTIRSCHEEATTENPSKGLRKYKDFIDIEYTPTVERGEACPMYLSMYKKNQKYSTALVVFEHPDYQLDATLYCNGFVSQQHGVSICQSREGLLQRIDFDEPVAIGDPVNGPADRSKDHLNCPKLPLTKDKKSTGLFLQPNRECIYPIIGLKSGKIHQFYTVGYENIILHDQ